MSDKVKYYETLRCRASLLRNELDEAIHALMNVERCVQDVGKADMGEPGELTEPDFKDLKKCVKQALFFTRIAEKANNDHIGEVDRALGQLGIDSQSAARRPTR